MKHFLRVGQVFRCRKFRDLVHRLKTGSDGRFTIPPEPDRVNLHFSHSDRTTACWTEKGKDGWERSCEKEIDLSVDDPDQIVLEPFTVTDISLTGGGHGHGPHDVFPDGHHVVAEDGRGRRVSFHQSGCFVGIVDPGDVELIGGPPDLPGSWRDVRVYEVGAG